jgi:hypothetical protein
MRKLQTLASLILLTSLLVLRIESPAQAAPAPCPSGAFFVGLHGLEEGQLSEIVHAVGDAFSSQLPNGQTVLKISVDHPVLHVDEFLQKLFGFGEPISQGVQLLDQDVSQAIARCPHTKIALFGFSEGAWILDAWLLQQDSTTLNHVAAAGVLGDPQYTLDNGCCIGIARRLVALPYPPAIPDRFWGNCANGDPICGGGYGPGLVDGTRQTADAWKLKDNCAPHCLAYPSAATRPLGEALGKQTAEYPAP